MQTILYLYTYDGDLKAFIKCNIIIIIINCNYKSLKLCNMRVEIVESVIFIELSKIIKN